MELTIARQAGTQVLVTCDSEPSHTFDVRTLDPDEQGPPQPIDDPVTYGKAVYLALFPLASPARRKLEAMPDRILLDVEPEVRERVYQHLDKFIIADDVTLEDASDSLTAINVEGPVAAEVMFELSAPIPEDPWSHLDWNGRIVARVNVTGEPGFRIFAPKEQEATLIGELAMAGLPPALAEETRVVRLEHAKPRYGEDIFENTLPQETQQMHALHFSKGCYIGQEIVERTRSRGHVNRMLVGLRIDSSEAPAAGTKLSAEGAEVGEITSAAFSPGLGKVAALGYVRSQYAAPGTQLKAGGASAVTVPVAGSCEAAPAPSAGC